MVSGAADGAGWIDVSVPLSPALVSWPGDTRLEIRRVSDMEAGAECNLSRLTMSAHTGTHLDAPLHFVANGAGIDAMPLDATVGPARVIAIEDPEAIRPEELARHDVQAGERILFRTRNSDRTWHDQPFDPRFVHVTEVAARYLVRCGVRTVGVDYLSVGAWKGDGVLTHRTLLGAGVWVIEGLDLRNVEPGLYEMVCLPLRISGGDGAPARAILRPR